MLPTELVQLLHNHVSVNGSAERGVFHNPELFIIEGGDRQDYDNTHRLIWSVEDSIDNLVKVNVRTAIENG